MMQPSSLAYCHIHFCLFMRKKVFFKISAQLVRLSAHRTAVLARSTHTKYTLNNACIRWIRMYVKRESKPQKKDQLCHNMNNQRHKYESIRKNINKIAIFDNHCKATK